jgi:putative nucleotidyltransferase with HDIG domain
MGRIFKEAGFSSYLVGGAVRDMLRGKGDGADWDVATDAAPDAVRRLFRRTIPTGIAHGTVTVLFMGHHIEVTTFRSDGAYVDGRRPDEVRFGVSLEEDLARRDFTINAMAASLETGEVCDPFGGEDDLKKGIIRTVGDPLARFGEDGLRPVRAIRFAATLCFPGGEPFALDVATKAAISPMLQKVAQVSIERFRDEFQKMLAAPTPSVALRLMEETGILRLFLPELADCRGVTQADDRGHHHFDVLDHLFTAADGAPQDKPLVRLAALFHDVGKPAVRQEETRRAANGAQQYIISYIGHEKVGASIARRVLTRLRFPTATVNAVTHLVAEHMFHYTADWSDGAVRRFLVRVGPENVADLFDLRLADCYGMRGELMLEDRGNCNWTRHLVELEKRINEVQTAQSALSLKDLAVNGKDLMESGIPAGKQLGAILQKLMETVLEHPEENEKNHLLEIARSEMSGAFVAP